LRVRVTLTFLLLVAACGSDAPAPDGNDGGVDPPGSDAATAGDVGGGGDASATASCTGTVGGAVSATFDCQVIFTNERELRFVKTTPRNDIAQLSVSLTLDEPFASRSYSLQDFSSATVILLMRDGTQFTGSPGVPGASLEITLTAIGALGPSSPTTHGNLTARVVEANADAGPRQSEISLNF
jgi:hypothetical protein